MLNRRDNFFSEEGHIIWALWTCRNKLVFDKQRPPAAITARLAISKAAELHAVLTQKHIHQTPQARDAPNWTPPPPEFAKLNTDGSVVQSNAAAGGIIRDNRGGWVAGFSMNIGPSTVHESELWGLRQGLFLALQIGLRKLIVEMDSLQIIQALTQTVHQNPPGPTLLTDFQGLLKKFDVFHLQHSPRNNNQAADKLAKLGHALPHGVTSYDSAPPELISIMCNDLHGPVP